MTLLDAQQTRVPFGVHEGATLQEVARKDPTYVTEFLAGRRATLDIWLAEAVDLMLENMPAPGAVSDERQAELFSDGTAT